MKICAIAAVAQNGVIGAAQRLPWRLPADMRYFAAKTLRHHVIMGRHTYYSLSKKYRPLPRRVKIVVARRKALKPPPQRIVATPEQGIAWAKKAGAASLFVIGGAELYRYMMPYCQYLYLTEIQASVDGDTYFPDIDWSLWEEVSRIKKPSDADHAFAFDFVTYRRRAQSRLQDE